MPSHTGCACSPSLGEGLVQPRGERGKGREKTAQTLSQDVRYTIIAPVFITSLRQMLHFHPFCRPAAEACVEHGEFQYLRDLGVLITDFHQKPTVFPGNCPSAGNEPVAVQGISPKVELAFAMLPLNTKLASLGKNFHFTTLLKSSLCWAYRKWEIKEKHRKTSHTVQIYFCKRWWMGGRALSPEQSSRAAVPHQAHPRASLEVWADTGTPWRTGPAAPPCPWCLKWLPRNRD